MAIDEAILEATGRGEVPPTLRLYAWVPPCLSLGYAQPILDVDLRALTAHGWDLVRRPTGGRAILHTDELTYSVSGPADDPYLAGSVLESYRNLSEALLIALHRLGIPAQVKTESAPRATPNTGISDTGEGVGAAGYSGYNGVHCGRVLPTPVNPVCFEVPSNYEITVNGKKLVGSAQARRKEGVLQHGSLPLCGDLARITQVLAFPDETGRSAAADRLRLRATTAQEVLGYPLPWEAAAQAFTSAFQEALNLKLEPGELTPTELSRAEQLVQEKYAHPEWMNKN